MSEQENINPETQPEPKVVDLPEPTVEEIAAKKEEKIANEEKVIKRTPLPPIPANFNSKVLVERWPYREARKHKEDTKPIYSFAHNFKISAGRSQQCFTAARPGDDWANALLISTLTGHNTPAFIDSLERDGSEWRQAVEHEGRKFAGRYEFYDNAPGKKLTGAQARAKHQSVTRNGGLFTFPVWGSGLWLTMKTPSDRDLNILDRAIGNRKKALGWWTQGMVFSAADVYINDLLFKFIIDHTVDANVKDFNPEDLRALVRSFDFYTLVWGLSCTIFVDGYNLSQPCTIDPDKCQHVIESLVNLNRLCFTDICSLTPNQIRHMALDDHQYTHEEIYKYQNEGSIADGKSYDIKMDEYGEFPPIKLVLKSCNMQEYLDSSKEWVSNLIFTVNTAIGNTFKSETERDEFIAKQAGLSGLRQYMHYVKRVVYDDGSYIEDAEEIINFLEDSSSETYIREQIKTSFEKFIESTVISVIAFPAFECPSCKGFNHSNHHLHPNLIPIEVNQFFFTLKDRRLWPHAMMRPGEYQQTQ